MLGELSFLSLTHAHSQLAGSGLSGLLWAHTDRTGAGWLWPLWAFVGPHWQNRCWTTARSVQYNASLSLLALIQNGPEEREEREKGTVGRWMTGCASRSR
jgi:hypothetical protein